MSTQTKKPDTQKAENDIRVGFRSRPKFVIKYATSTMKDKKYKELKFSAVGVSIGKLVQIVEVLKVVIPDLYQQNRITSVAYQTIDSNQKVLKQQLYPKLEVILSTEPFKEKNEGTQDKLDEKDRKLFEEHMKKRSEEIEKNRGRGRGRGRRGGFRARRGRFRGRRFGFRGNRGAFRGGRGNRDGPKKEGNVRGRGRGGQRGAQRGGQQASKARGTDRKSVV